MPDLFDAAAERAAIASGRPKSQERTELMGGATAPPVGGLFAGALGLPADDEPWT